MMSTESVDPRYADIDRWPTALAVEAMFEGQLAAIASIKSQIAAIAAASDAAAATLKSGGRLVYAGAGTSGRIAVQDGVELGPTFDWPSERLVFLLAGGMNALAESAEAAEDDSSGAAAEIISAAIGTGDVVVGIAASGRTPYALSAIETARGRGALTIGIANNPGSPLLAAAEFALLADTGSEAIAGSTRMKAGTAQKALLNLFSTATMMRCGRVYRGQMVEMRVSNDKLLARAKAMVSALAEVDEVTAARALAEGGNSIKSGILLARGMSASQAEDLLERHDRNLGRALDALAEGVGR